MARRPARARSRAAERTSPRTSPRTSRTLARRRALARAALCGAPLAPRVRGPLPPVAIERGGRVVTREEHEAFTSKLGYERAHPARAWLRTARWEGAWRRPALTAALGLPKSMLSRLEQDPDYVVHPDYAARLREALGLSEADTLAISDDPGRCPRPPHLRRPGAEPVTAARTTAGPAASEGETSQPAASQRSARQKAA